MYARMLTHAPLTYEARAAAHIELGRDAAGPGGRGVWRDVSRTPDLGARGAGVDAADRAALRLARRGPGNTLSGCCEYLKYLKEALVLTQQIEPHCACWLRAR